MGSPNSLSPKAPSPYARQKSNEPANDAKTYFGMGGSYIRPDKYGDNIGKPNTPKEYVSTRTLALKARDKREAQLSPVKCTEVKHDQHRWSASTVKELRDILKRGGDHGLEVFNGDSDNLKDYHIIYDTSTWLWKWKPPGYVSVALYGGPEQYAETGRGDSMDEDACVDRYASGEELHKKLIDYLRTGQKNLVLVFDLFMQQDTIQFLRDQAAKDPSLKFVLVTWSPKTVEIYTKLYREQQARQHSAPETQGMDWFSVPALAIYGAVGVAAWKLIDSCRGRRDPVPPHRH